MQPVYTFTRKDDRPKAEGAKRVNKCNRYDKSDNSCFFYRSTVYAL